MNHETSCLVVAGEEVASSAWYFCSDDSSTIDALKPSVAVNNYSCLKASGFSPAFPAGVILSLEVVLEKRRSGYGRQLLRTVLSELRQRQVKTVFAKVGYDCGEEWKEERGWKEKFYLSEGFTIYSDDNIRPLMSLRFT